MVNPAYNHPRRVVIPAQAQPEAGTPSLTTKFVGTPSLTTAFVGTPSLIIALCLIFLGAGKVYSQCSTPASRSNPTILLGMDGTAESNVGLKNIGNSTSFYMNSNSYFVIESAGTRSIRISTCGASYNSQITLRDWSTDTYLASNDDNGPVCTGTSASIDYSGSSSYPHIKVILTESGCTASSISTYVTVTYVSDINNVTPDAPTSIGATYTTICNGNSTTLTANGAVGTVYWYTVSCGGTATSPATGNTLTVSPSATTIYYARNYNNGAFSAGCASISITVNPISAGGKIKWPPK